MRLLSHPDLDLNPRVQRQRASATLQLLQPPSSCSSHHALVPGVTLSLLSSFWSPLDAPRGGVVFEITRLR